MYECENSLLFSLQNHRNFGGFVVKIKVNFHIHTYPLILFLILFFLKN